MEMSSPGFARLTQADVAGMLSNFPTGPFLMGMVRYAGDESSAPALEAELVASASTIAQDARWPGGARRVPQLVKLALWELLYGARCRHCHGVGYVMSGENPRHCEVCDGKRVRRMTELERASWAGMSERHWRRDWSARYETIYGLADSWEQTALSLMRRRLRENGE